MLQKSLAPPTVRQQNQALLAALRALLKQRRLTYAQLARLLRVSEPTIKRTLGGRTQLNTARLLEICGTLGISLGDLVKLAQGGDHANYFLKPEQEAVFAKHPGLFGIFRALYLGGRPATVRKAWGLTGPQFYRALRRLEKLGLLEVRAGEEISFRVQGVVRWSHTGPMTRALVPEQNARFLAYVYQHLGRDTTSFLTSEFEMTEATFTDLHRDLQALGEKFRARSLRESQTSPAEGLISVRWLAAAAPFRTDWTRYGV